MKTLYLHIGTPKTATSSIQAFCRTNRRKLRTYGYSFPIMPFSYHKISAGRNAHFLVGATAEQELTEKQEAFYQERLQAGFTTIHKKFALYDNVILTDESLWRAINYTKWNAIEAIQKDAANNNYVVKVVVYLRRQDQFMLSRWNQQIKKGEMTATCQEHFARMNEQYPLLSDYAKTLDIVADLIGKENLIVRRFEPSTWVNHSIYADFLDALGLNPNLPLDIPTEEVNPGLKGNYFEIKRIINGSPELSLSERDYFGAYAWKLSNEQEERYHYNMLSEEETNELLHLFSEGNERIVREYIRDDKPLFSDKRKPLPTWQPNNEYMHEDIVHFFTSVSVDLHRENELLRNEIIALQQETRQLNLALEKQRNDILIFKNKLKHPFRTLWNRIFKKGTYQV